MKKNKKILTICGYLFIFISFVIASIFFLFLVKGYKYDFKTGEIKKTGMIILASHPSGAEIYLNDKLYRRKTGFSFFPTKISRLDPDKYHLKVIKEGYKDWQKTLEVEPELVSWANYILLIKEEIKPEEVTQDLDIKNNYPSLNNKQSILLVNNKGFDELWLMDLSNLEKKKIFPTENQKIKGEEDQPIQQSSYSITNISWSGNENYILFNRKGAKNNFTALNVGDSDDITSITNLFKLEIENLTWNSANSNELFWFKNNNLYKLNISNKTLTAALEDKIISFKITKNKIFYVKVGKKENNFWQMDLDGENKIEILQALPASAGYKIIHSDKLDYPAVLTEETKTLILVSKKDNQILTKQFPHSINNALWSFEGERLMYFNNNNVWTYDIDKQKEYQVINTSSNIDYCSWYFDDAHIIMNYDNSFKLIEFDGWNITQIADCKEKTKILFLENYKSFFFLKENKIKQTDLYKVDIQ